MKKMFILSSLLFPLLSVGAGSGVVESCRLFQLDTGISVVVREGHGSDLLASVTRRVSTRSQTNVYAVKRYFPKSALAWGYRDHLNEPSNFDLSIVDSPTTGKRTGVLTLNGLEENLNCQRLTN